MAGLWFTSQALEVESTAGTLNQLIVDHDVTSLTLTGTIDARDFQFIGDSLTHLKELDMSAVEILAYDDGQALLTGVATTFAAQTIPAALLMDLPLEHVVLPAATRGIGQAAFAGCLSLATIELPETLRIIGPYAFSGSGLTTIVVPDSVSALGEGAFSRYMKLTSAEVRSPQVGDYAFLGDSCLASVTLADAVTTLGKGAFSGCSALQQLSLGEASSLSTIGDEAFIGSGISTLDFMALPALTTIGNYAFAGTPLQQVSLPSGMTTLGEGAFFYADSIRQVTLPADITMVPALSLAGLSQATTEQPMSEGVVNIGDYAFYGWNSAQYFTLPSTVQYIGTKAMAGMTALQQLNVLGDVAQLGDSVWAYIDQPAVNLDVVNGNIPDFEAALQWRDFHVLHPYLLGDVNADGFVDVMDVSTTIGYILGETPPVFIYPAANIMADSLIDVMDVSGITDLVLTGTHEIIKAVQGQGVDLPGNSYPTTTDRLAIDDLVLPAGQSRALEVKLVNDQPYTAMQCDVILPEGVSVDASRSAATARAGHHTLCVEPTDYGCRIMLYSMAGHAIDGNNGTLINLMLQSDEYSQTGGSVRLANIILGRRYEGFMAPSVEAYIDNLTGVDEVAAPVLAVNGGKGVIEVLTSQAGTLQVVSMNGVTRSLDVQPGSITIDAAPGVYVVRMGDVSKKIQVK